MGLGDNLMASGFARGAKARGKRIAFGDGHKIIWDYHSEAIFGQRSTQTENPNVARPGDEDGTNLEWVPFYRGSRIYNTQAPDLKHWIWNYGFRPTPGEIYFSDEENSFADNFGEGFIVIEPNVPEYKTVAPNKQWPVERYNEVARLLKKAGHYVVQFKHSSGHEIPDAIQIKTPTFRHGARVLKNAALFIGAEGGLHHAAAAVDTRAVVLFGGFIPPAVTGYDFHTNLTGGAIACGSFRSCGHCAKAMDKISVPDVVNAARGHLRVAQPTIYAEISAGLSAVPFITAIH